MWWNIFLSFVAGCALGGLFFGGLWWTVNRLNRVKYPSLLILASFFLRTATVLAVLFLFLRGGGGWPAAAAALAGFLLVRLALVFLIRPKERPRVKKEGDPGNGH